VVADGRHEAHFLRIHVECVHDPAQKKGKLRRLGSHIGMRLVKHNPLQKPFRGIEDRPILTANEHVLEHSRIGDEDRRRFGAQQLAGKRLFRVLALHTVSHSSWCLPVVEAKPYAPVERRGPGTQPITLTVDECVEGIQKERTNAVECLPLFLSPNEIIEYGNEKTLGLPGARAAGDDHRPGGFTLERLPRGKLMAVGRSIRREAILATFGRWCIHRRDEVAVKHRFYQAIHGGWRRLPPEHRFEHGVSDETAFPPGVTFEYMPQVLA